MAPGFAFSLQRIRRKRAISRAELWIRAKMSSTTHVDRYIRSDWLIKKLLLKLS